MMRQAIKALLRLEKNIDNQLNFERFIRTYAPLDAEEECRYNETYADEVAHMMSVREEVISSVREELERKGEARGRLIGREEGREEGRGDGQRHTLARPLARRFGLLDAGSVRRLAAGTPYVALEQASIDRCLACGLRKCYFTHHG